MLLETGAPLLLAAFCGQLKRGHGCHSRAQARLWPELSGSLRGTWSGRRRHGWGLIICDAGRAPDIMEGGGDGV